MSRPSMLSLLSQTEPKALGSAPRSVKAWVALVWSLALFGMGHAWVVAPKASAVAHTQTLTRNITEDIAEVRVAIQAQQADILDQHHAQIEHQAAQDQMGLFMSQHAWLAEAKALTEPLNLRLDRLTPTTPIQPIEISDSSDLDGIDWVWVDASLNDVGLMHFDVEVVVTGAFGSVLHWLDLLQYQQRIWPYQVELHPSVAVIDELPADSVTLKAGLRIMGFAHEDLSAPVLARPSMTVPKPTKTIRWQAPNPDWWQALPLARFDLMGTGRIDGQSWVWLMDPSQRLRALTLGDVIGPNDLTIMAIEPDALVLQGAKEDSPIHWVWQ